MTGHDHIPHWLITLTWLSLIPVSLILWVLIAWLAALAATGVSLAFEWVLQ